MNSKNNNNHLKLLKRTSGRFGYNLCAASDLASSFGLLKWLTLTTDIFTTKNRYIITWILSTPEFRLL